MTKTGHQAAMKDIEQMVVAYLLADNSNDCCFLVVSILRMDWSMVLA
jgi:hypothetical protein